MPNTNHWTESEKQRKIRERKKELADNLLVWIGNKKTFNSDIDVEEKRIKNNEDLTKEKKIINSDFDKKEKNLLEGLKKQWQEHIHEAECDLNQLKTTESKEIEKRVDAICKKYDEAVKNQQFAYRDDVTKIENEIKAKYNERKETLEKQKEILEKQLVKEEEELKKDQGKLEEVQKKFEPTRKMWIDYDKLIEEINRKNEKKENTEELKKKLKKLNDSVQKNKKNLDVLAKEKTDLVKKIKNLTEEIEHLKSISFKLVKDELSDIAIASEKELKKRKDDAYDARSKKASELENQKADEIRKETRDGLQKISVAEAKLNEDKLYEVNRSAHAFEMEELKKQRNQALEQCDAKYETIMNDFIENEQKKIQEKYNELYDRLGKGAEFEVDIAELKDSPKKKNKPNTIEFNTMTNALDAAVRSIENCDSLDVTIQIDCLEAYKKCRDYVAAKNAQGKLANFFRSDNGMDRIRMANAMMQKLKEFYPGLEQALATGVEPKRPEPERVIQKHPEPRRDLGTKLNEARNEIRKMNEKAKNNESVDAGAEPEIKEMEKKEFRHL